EEFLDGTKARSNARRGAELRSIFGCGAPLQELARGLRKRDAVTLEMRRAAGEHFLALTLSNRLRALPLAFGGLHAGVAAVLPTVNPESVVPLAVPVSDRHPSLLAAWFETMRRFPCEHTPRDARLVCRMPAL